MGCECSEKRPNIVVEWFRYDGDGGNGLLLVKVFIRTCVMI